MSFRWTVTPGQAFEELYENYTKALFVSGRRVADARAEQMLTWAKSNHPWQNRTGAAEAGLHVEVTQAPAVVAEIVLAHGVDHGLWLEIANQGRYGVIAMSIDVWGPIFMRDMQNIANLKLVTRGD